MGSQEDKYLYEYRLLSSARQPGAQALALLPPVGVLLSSGRGLHMGMRSRHTLASRHPLWPHDSHGHDTSIRTLTSHCTKDTHPTSHSTSSAKTW